MSYELVLNNELYHHGIKGQKWGVRRYQNPDGTLTDRGIKRRNKALTTENPKILLKNRNLLTKEEYEDSYNRVKMKRDLKEWSKPSESARKAQKVIIELALIAGTAAFLTKTKVGQDLVKKGKDLISNKLKEAGNKTVDSIANAATNTVKSASSNAKEAVKQTRSKASNNFKSAVKKNNKAARALYNYGKTIDKIIRSK